MSNACYVVCLDCKEPAPMIGGGGFLGLASLADQVQISEWPYPPFGDPRCEIASTFGHLYRAFRAVGIQPVNCELFYAYLERHAGHRIYQGSEGDYVLPAECEAVFDDAVYQAAEDALLQPGGAERITPGRYCVTCGQCSVGHECEHAERLALLGGTVSPEAAELFIDRIGTAQPELNCHLVGPHIDLYDPFVQGLLSFFKEHSAHDLTFRVHAQQSERPGT